MDLNNFHGLIPSGYRRKEPWIDQGRKKQIVNAVDEIIKKEQFDITAYILLEQERAAFEEESKTGNELDEQKRRIQEEINSSIAFIYTTLLQLGFREEELKG